MTTDPLDELCEQARQAQANAELGLRSSPVGHDCKIAAVRRDRLA